jgi:hypothetical protein
MPGRPISSIWLLVVRSITIGFGPNLAIVPASLLIYHDQNGDGLPNDLLLLKRVDITLGPYAPIGGAVSTFTPKNSRQ